MKTDYSPTSGDSCSYATDLLNFYSTPIALERPDALLFMQVGGKRVAIMKQILGRIRAQLGVGCDRPKPGSHMELLLGDFGCGKSHLGYLIKHDCLTGMPDLMVAHVQITNECSWQTILAAILRNLRLTGAPSEIVADVEISAFRELLRWCGGQPGEVAHLARNTTGPLPAEVATDLARSLAPLLSANPDSGMLIRFLDAWVLQAGPKQAMQVLQMILRMFYRLQQRRLVLIIDEFEAIESLETRRQIETLQCFQDMFDDLSGRLQGLPSAVILLLSTPGWWERSANLLPSMFARGQRVRAISQLPEFSATDVAALVYRYIMLLQLSFDDLRTLEPPEVQQLIGEIIEENSAYLHQVRTLHSAVREKLISRMLTN
jgi:hypothetical protein